MPRIMEPAVGVPGLPLIGVERAALPSLVRLLNMALVMITTRENSFNGVSHTPTFGVASFALRMNRGNSTENTQPLRMNALGSSDRIASGSPKPKKYGQFVSMYVSRLCSSQPMLYHLYSKAYSEQSRLM